MKYIFISFILFSLFASCETSEKKNPETKNEMTDKPDTTREEALIVDPEFINYPFEFGDVNINELKKKFGENVRIKKQPIENIHVEGQIDTLYTVVVRNSKFIIYKIPTDQFLESAVIEDSLIQLSRNISVGISKNDFKKKFSKLENTSITDTVTVQGGDAEGYMVFIFQNDLLNRIEFYGYVD